jgi:hypothetical protein
VLPAAAATHCRTVMSNETSHDRGSIAVLSQQHPVTSSAAAVRSAKLPCRLAFPLHAQDSVTNGGAIGPAKGADKQCELAHVAGVVPRLAQGLACRTASDANANP